MRIIAVLVVGILFFASVDAIGNILEIQEAQIAGENDAKGFQWKWFTTSYLLSNSAPLLLIGAVYVSEKSNLFDDTIANMDPRFCFAICGIHALVPTAIAMIQSPTPPPDRLLGKSPVWIEAYTKAYQKHMKKKRIGNSILGCVGGTVTGAGMIYLIFASIGLNTAD